MIPYYNEVNPSSNFSPSKTLTNFTVALVNDLITKINAQGFDSFVSVKSYGAVGNGVTDDSAAIMAADIAASALGTLVLFPSGTYAAHDLEMTAGWVMVENATLLYNGATEGECLRCSVNNLICGDIYIDCDGKEPRTVFYLEGDDNFFKSVRLKNTISTNQAWIVRGLYDVGNNNTVAYSSIEDFVNSGNTNASSPQGVVTDGTADGNSFFNVFARNARSAVVNAATGTNNYGQVVSLESKDNGFYSVAGNVSLDSLTYDGDDNGAGFRSGANAEIGSIYILRSDSTSVFFGDCGNISINSIQVNGNTNAILHTNLADTGDIRIGSITGSLIDTTIFALPKANGTIRSLSIDNIDVQVTLTSAFSGSTRSMVRFDGVTGINLGRTKIDVVVDGYTPTDPFYAQIADDLALYSSINTFRFGLFESDGVTPYSATCRVVATDGTNLAPLAQSLLRLGEGALDTNGYLRPYSWGGFKINQLTASEAPTVGTWTAGTVIWSESPSAQVLGWVCTTAGTPGTWTPFGAVADGSYTPTTFNTTNLDGSTPSTCYWYQVGKKVTVFGTISVDATAAGATATEMGVSLPVASDLVSSTHLVGLGQVGAYIAVRITGDITNDRAKFEWLSANTSAVNLYFEFSYRLP